VVETNLPDALVDSQPGAQAPPGGGIETASFIGRRLDDPILEAARANPTLTIAVATGALVVARLLAVSGFRVDVALALLTSAGIANVVVGSATSAVPTVAPLLTLVLSDLALTYYRAERRALPTALAAAFAAMLSLLVTPAWLVATYVVSLLGLQVLVRFRARRGRPHFRLPENPAAYVLSVAVLPLFVPVVLSSAPWLPPESIVSAGSAAVGYVIQSDARWTHVLLDAPRAVQIYETSAITSRTSCEMPPSPVNSTLLQLVVRRSILPDCPVP
jgi:hypothetical protein